MLSFRRLLIISRPISYVPAVTVYAASLLLSHSGLSWKALLGLIFFTVPMGLIAYGINDITDRESDLRNVRKGKVDGAVLRSEEAKTLQWIIAATLCISLAASAAAKSFGLFAMVAVISLLAYAYSVPPLRLKSRPILDSLANGAWIGSIFLAGYWTNMAGFELRFPSLRLLLTVILCAATYHALTTVIDLTVDKENGDTTISVYLGRSPTILLCVFAFLACSFLIGIFSIVMSVYLAACALVIGFGYFNNSPAAIRRICLLIVFLLPLALAGTLIE